MSTRDAIGLSERVWGTVAQRNFLAAIDRRARRRQCYLLCPVFSLRASARLGESATRPVDTV